jgi:hypothetical protein
VVAARIFVDSIRCYYQRKGGEGTPGTRITFRDGGGFVVSESPEEVDAMIEAVAA